MNNDLQEVFNKGVPISTPITITVNDILELSEDRERTQERIDRRFKRFTNYLKQKGNQSEIEFFQTMCLISNPETLDKELYFSFGGFLSSLFFALNIFDICKKYSYNDALKNVFEVSEDNCEKFIPIIKERVEKFKSIKTENRLKKDFPILYTKYREEKELYNSIKETNKLMNSKAIPPEMTLQIKRKQICIMKEMGYDEDEINNIFEISKIFSFDYFKKEFSESFNKLADNIPDIFNYLTENKLNANSLFIHNDEKLNLYLAVKHMEMSESFNNEAQRFIYYVTNYFNEDKSRRDNEKVKLEVGKNYNEQMGVVFDKGYVITPKQLYTRYKNFLVEHPEIKVVDFSKVDFSNMNLVEVEEFVKEYISDLQTNWEIIPEGEFDNTIVKEIEKNRCKTNEIDKEKHQERLIELYMEKQDFYGNTDPFFRVKGKNTFDGYVGFIYTNGKVVLDKFYEKASTGKLADGEAIYIMNIGDFYRLSQFPKSTLIKDERVKRIYHTTDWQGKVDKIINNKENNSNTAEEVKQLLKTNKLKEAE